MKKFKRIYLEISRSCNLNCSFCPSVYDPRIMSLEDIKLAIDKTSMISDYYYLHVLGEPTSHPDFEEVLNYLDKQGKHVQLVTNGTLLKNYPDILRHQSLRKLSVSVHSIDHVDVPSTYYQTLDYLVKEIDKYPDKSLEYRFYNADLNNNSISYLKHLDSNFCVKGTSKTGSYKLKDNLYIYFQDMFKWPDINDIEGTNIGKCHGGKDMLAILVNGDVTLCCLDPSGFNKIGNIFTDSIEDILNSKIYTTYLKDLSENRINLKLCRRCTYKDRFKK